MIIEKVKKKNSGRMRSVYQVEAKCWNYAKATCIFEQEKKLDLKLSFWYEDTI